MKYLLRNGKVEFSGSRKALINYIKEKDADDYFVKEYGNIFETDFGRFKYVVENLGLQLSDKMTNKEYKKTHRR